MAEILIFWSQAEINNLGLQAFVSLLRCHYRIEPHGGPRAIFCGPSRPTLKPHEMEDAFRHTGETKWQKKQKNFANGRKKISATTSTSLQVSSRIQNSCAKNAGGRQIPKKCCINRPP